MHPLVRVVSFRVVGRQKIEVTFDDGSVQAIDFAPVLAGPLFGPLRNERLFREVAIDPAEHTLMWPNGADFDPATLYYWDRHASELAERAREWGRVKAAG